LSPSTFAVPGADQATPRCGPSVSDTGFASSVLVPRAEYRSASPAAIAFTKSSWFSAVTSAKPSGAGSAVTTIAG
jgi:hypothetical protein